MQTSEAMVIVITGLVGIGGGLGFYHKFLLDPNNAIIKQVNEMNEKLTSIVGELNISVKLLAKTVDHMQEIQNMNTKTIDDKFIEHEKMIIQNRKGIENIERSGIVKNNFNSN